MGRPKRIDNPTKITLLLSAACHRQLTDLCVGSRRSRPAGRRCPGPRWSSGPWRPCIRP